MRKIIPLDGYITATTTSELKSIDSEISEIKGLNFLTVDKTAKRNEAVGNKTRIRLFHVEQVSENAGDTLKSFVGKNMYCRCLEKEDDNNIIVDKETGNKIFVIPVMDILAELKDLD